MEINHKDHAVIVCSYSNTEFKKQTLIECLNTILPLGFDIILSSHYPETKDVYSLANYFIYDSNDPVISYKNYYDNLIINFVYWEDSNYRIDWIPPFIHDYSVFTALKNGFKLAQALDKKFIHIIEYDCLVNKDLYLKELIFPLYNNYDISYTVWDANIKHLMATYLFSFKTESFTNLFDSINCKEDFFDKKHSIWQLERVFNDYRINSCLKSYFHNYSPHLMNRNQIFQQTNFLNELRFCADEYNNFYIHVRPKSECLINIVYEGSSQFKLLKEPDTFRVGEYKTGAALQIFHEGKTIYNKIINEKFEDFYRLNKLRVKKTFNFYSYLDKSFQLGMRQNYEEIEQFCKFLESKPIKNFLEIGTDQGGSFLLFSQLSDKDGIKISIDLPHINYGLTNFDTEKRNDILRKQPGQIFLLEADSHQHGTLSNIKNILNGEKLDFLFIDGDHSFEGVKSDFDMYSPLVRDGGLIVFHDINYSKLNEGELINVWEFWNMLEGDKHEFTSTFFWGGIGVIVKNSNLKFNNLKVKTSVDINYHFVNGSFCEVLGEQKHKYLITISNSETKKVLYKTEILNNNWSQCFVKYFVPYRMQVCDINEKGLIFDYTMNLRRKRVYIVIDSKSLGDTLAWIPYVEEFRKKHLCNVICSTFWNELFLKSYPSISFMNPGTTIGDLYAMYEVGWFENKSGFRNPIDPRTVPLQKIASDILGLDFKPIKPTIDIRFKERIISEKYVCISTASTCQAKFWNYVGGWQEVVNYLNGQGFKVVITQKESCDLDNVVFTPECDIKQTINYLNHCEFFIGLSSGVSWLAWALSKPVIMISGVTKPWNEFDCIRIHNNIVCNGCFNSTETIFDKSDWNWCPFNKSFECTKTITPELVINSIQNLINV